MKKFFKSLLGIALVASLALSLTLEPAYAATEPVSYSNKIAFYMGSKDSIALSSQLYVSRPNSNKVTGAKTSSKNVLVTGIVNYNSKTEGSAEGWNTNYEGTKYDVKEPTSGSNYYSYIYYRFNKVGTATLSFTVKGDKKKYTNKSVISVYKYENPVKNITISGVNKNRSFAALTKERSYISNSESGLKVSKATDTSVISVTPNKDWRVSYIYFYEYDKDYNALGYSYYSMYNSKAGQTIKHTVDGLDKNTNYRVNVSFYNVTTGGSLSTNYYINY